jgi:hypothetical protein
MLGMNDGSYNVVVWVTSPVSGPFITLWLNCEHHASISESFDSLVAEIGKTSLLPNIRDDAINALLGPTQGTFSSANYSQLLNDFLRRSRQPLTDDLQCVRFINGLAILFFQAQAKSYRTQEKGDSLPLVELQKNI